MLGFFRRRREAKEQRLLSILQENGELSGYELSIADGRLWSLATLYPLLERMEKDGRIVSRWGTATAVRGWRRPRLYRVNQPGRP